MSKPIDCLFIGHNEVDFEEHEKMVEKMGTHSGVYRDLNLNFIRYNNKAHTLRSIFNLFNRGEPGKFKPIKLVETFSAAIAYLGSYLCKRGFTFDYVNSFREEKEELAKKLEQDNILAVAIITTLYISAIPILEIVDFVRRHNPEVKIIIGGPYVSTRVRTMGERELEYLFGNTIKADFFVNSSQGEGALVKLLEALKNGCPVSSIENIYYHIDGRFRSTPRVREDNKLAENSVDWGLFRQSIGEYVNVRTAISCPFSCTFCGFPQHAGKYQTAPVEIIEAELNRLEEIGTVKRIYFIDDTFNVPVKRFKEILRMLIKNKYHFTWHSYFRCQFADRETVELMKESGCEGAFLGIESGNDRILENMNKVCTLQKYYAGIGLLKEYGITTFGAFITGFPGETEQTVQDTIEFIENSGLDFYRSQLWYAEPITPIWKEREKYKIRGESFEWRHSTMDSRGAADLIDYMFLTIKKPVWVPQYHFDFESIWHLKLRGMSMERIKDLIKWFNRGVKEKLTNPARRETDYEVITQLKQICMGVDKPFDVDRPTAGSPKEEKDMIDKYGASFEF